jgi:hypothetical protein
MDLLLYEPAPFSLAPEDLDLRPWASWVSATWLTRWLLDVGLWAELEAP